MQITTSSLLHLFSMNKSLCQFDQSITLLQKEIQNSLLGVQNEFLIINFSSEMFWIFQEWAIFTRVGVAFLSGFERFLAKEPQIKATRIELNNLLTKHYNVTIQMKTDLLISLLIQRMVFFILLNQVLKPLHGQVGALKIHWITSKQD